MRVVDPDQVQPGIVDLVHDPDLVAGLDPVVVGARLVRLGGEEPLRAVATPGKDAARLVGQARTRVRDDLVAHRGRDHHQTRSSIFASSSSIGVV